MDYLLVADGKVVGSVEAKLDGLTFSSVETRADPYSDGSKGLVAVTKLSRCADELLFRSVSAAAAEGTVREARSAPGDPNG